MNLSRLFVQAFLAVLPPLAAIDRAVEYSEDQGQAQGQKGPDHIPWVYVELHGLLVIFTPNETRKRLHHR